MEESANDIKAFLKKLSELTFTPSEFNLNPKIVGNYKLNKEDVATQVIDWVLYHLEDRKCPYNLAVSIAKATSEQIESSLSEQQLKENPTSEEKLLNSLALYTDAIKKMSMICNSYLEEVNEMDLQPLSLPYAASVFAIKNKRRKMEDRHVIHHDLNLLLDLKNCPRHSYYAVFDGHSGVDAASYASAHLHVNIANHPSFLTDTVAAISESYKITDQNFSKKCFEENLRSGTTAVCALFREKTIFLSWVGDSQAVLVKKGKPAIVTSPHKPDREDEQKRVEDLGGTIQFIGTYRVNGMLAVTRAIGDADHKPFISSEPEITVVNLDDSEDFLILACDGLWDGISPEDAVSALYYNILENGQDDPIDTMAAKLVHQSKIQGSEDNITAVVIFLRDIKVIKEEAQNYIPNLSKTNLQMNLFEANGDDKALLDMVMSTPISKPNVLEFNNSSIKKLKNTANVLSAAGLGDSFTDYVETYHASNFNQLSEPSAVPVIAPETTALSELPTPPIDDVMAFQQFEKICSSNLAQKLDLVSASDTNSPLVNFEDNFTKEFQASNPEEIISENNKNSLLNEELSPEEAVDIASTVVSNTIETAVKCISEKESNEAIIRVSPQKLNPYAEPFIMKSFVPSETIECNIVNICPSAPELSTILSNADTNCSKDIKELITVETDLIEQGNNIEITTCSSPVLENAQKSFNELITESHLPTELQIPVSSKQSSEDSPLIDMQITLVDDSVLEDFESPNTTISQIKEDIQINNPLQIMDSAKDEPEDIVTTQNVIDVLNTEQNKAEKSVIEITSEDNVIEVMENESISPLKEFLEKENVDSTATIQNVLEQCHEVIFESETLVKQNIQKIELIDISTDLANDKIIDIKPDCPETDLSVKANHTSSELLATESSLVAHFANLSTNNKVINPNCEEFKSMDMNKETEEHLLGDKVPEAAIILGGLSLPLVDVETAAVLPSDHSEECHTETVAVDLQSIPVGVPEAEGVTEDVDSDSEKDGGWSYMKGNVAGEKNKSSSEKSTKEGISKLKKDAQKPIDIKSKVKSTNIVDKNKRLLTEKKPLEVKSKMSKPMFTNTIKTVVDKPKVTTSVAKKPIQAAAKATTSNKISGSTTAPRNVPTLNKSVPSTSRTQTTIRPASSNISKSKPIVGVSATSTLPTTNSHIKKQPSTQSMKTNTLSARTNVNRPATSMVPNRALSATKPTILQKTSAEAKPKQPSTTLKQTVSSTLRKPEVKETKDISNKQLSERKSPLPKIASKGAISSISTLKSTSSGIKPTTARSHTVPPKTEMMKNVPKTQISRLAAKNAIQVKSTKDSSKTTIKNSSSFQKKVIQKTNQISKPGDKTNDAKPSEEEKLLREVNDVEIPTKELDDGAAAIDIKEKPPVENGHVSESEKTSDSLRDESVPNPIETLL